jgi:hypothetical protein
MLRSPSWCRSWPRMTAALAVAVAVASFMPAASSAASVRVPARSAVSNWPALRVPKTVVLDGSRLASTRKTVEAGGLAHTVGLLTAYAKPYLTQGPWSVMDKPELPPSGNKHDYLSEAPYWWPTEPATASNPYGCPYVDKDGDTNPAIYNITDHAEELTLVTAVYYLTLAWYYTGKAQYADRAELDLRTWFINSATRMDPNLNFTQFIPCQVTGRGIGIIDFSQGFTDILDSTAILDAGAPSWTTADHNGMQTWYREFLSCLKTSPNAAQEAAQTNNHGSFFDLQEAGLALATGQKTLAKNIVKAAETKRLNVQLAADGTEPLEITRTRSWHYSIFNLTALTRLAMLGQQVGVNLWKYTTPSGGTLFKSINFLIPAATGAATWQYPEMDFLAYAATDVIHAAADAGDHTAKSAVSKLPPPPGGDLWTLRPAPEQLDPVVVGLG